MDINGDVNCVLRMVRADRIRKNEYAEGISSQALSSDSQSMSMSFCFVALDLQTFAVEMTQ